MSLKTKLKVTKGYNNSHNVQYVIKLLDLIRSAIFGVGEHLKGPWSMKKSDKFLYTFFQRSNTTNNDHMKEFDAYVKVIDYNGGRTNIHPGIVKDKLTKMGVQDTENTTPEEKDKS